jgi:hypothetical protein
MLAFSSPRTPTVPGWCFSSFYQWHDMAPWRRNALPGMSRPRRPDKHFCLGCVTSRGPSATLGHGTCICPSAMEKTTCHHRDASTKDLRAQDHRRPTLHRCTRCQTDTLFLPQAPSKLSTFLWKNHVFEIRMYFPLSVALSYPWSLVTSDSSDGLGSGLTWGLVRGHA